MSPDPTIRKAPSRWPLVLSVLALAAALGNFACFRLAQLRSVPVPPMIPGAFTLLLGGYLVYHAGRTHGVRTGPAFLLTAALLGWGAETLGLATGLPFGRYRYLPTAGPTLPGGVPVVIPAFWSLMAYLVERAVRLAAPHTGPVIRLSLGAAVIAAWDLVADPLAVEYGAWEWLDGGAWFGIPLSNTLGWFLVGWIILAVGNRLGAGRSGAPADPFGLVPVAGLLLAVGNHTLGVAGTSRAGAAWAGLILLGLLIPLLVRGWRLGRR